MPKKSDPHGRRPQRSNADHSDEEELVSNGGINSGNDNQQESELDNWADAQEGQVNVGGNESLASTRNDINDQLNNLRLDLSSIDNFASSSHCLDEQSTESCTRTCLTDIDKGTGSLILHEAIFNDNTELVYQILNNKELAQQTVNKKDKHGNTPLHLACMLGRSKEIVKALLDNKASIECKNLNRWAPFHEAISYGNRDVIALMTKKLDDDLHNNFYKNKLAEKLAKTKNYSMALRWEFQSWVPLVARALPNDLCLITKYGEYIKIDTGLFEYGCDLKWMSGRSRDCSLIFNHKKKWMVLNHLVKRYQYIEGPNFERKNLEDRVDECMAIDIIDLELRSSDIQLTRSTSGWFWKADETDKIGLFDADIYNFDNIHLVMRKRREHLREEDIKRNKMGYKAAISIFKFGKKPTFEDLNEDEKNTTDVYESDRPKDGDSAVEVEHRESLPAPPPTNVTWEEYLNSEPGNFPVLGRKHKCKTSTTAFKASVAMSKQFPIDKSEFLDLLSIVPMRLFKNLKEFIEMRLPEGFPVRLDIPVFPPFLTSRITFEDFKFIEEPIDESLFNIPDDYKEDPNLYPRLAGQRSN